ncbi:hypothetical protein GOODEAATRI_003271, partial [Goodea atripinnis]
TFFIICETKDGAFSLLCPIFVPLYSVLRHFQRLGPGFSITAVRLRRRRFPLGAAGDAAVLCRFGWLVYDRRSALGFISFSAVLLLVFILTRALFSLSKVPPWLLVEHFSLHNDHHRKLRHVIFTSAVKCRKVAAMHHG